MVNKLNVILSWNINQTELDRNLRVLSLHFNIMAVVGNLELGQVMCFIFDLAVLRTSVYGNKYLARLLSGELCLNFLDSRVTTDKELFHLVQRIHKCGYLDNIPEPLEEVAPVAEETPAAPAPAPAPAQPSTKRKNRRRSTRRRIRSRRPSTRRPSARRHRRATSAGQRQNRSNRRPPCSRSRLMWVVGAQGRLHQPQWRRKALRRQSIYFAQKGSEKKALRRQSIVLLRAFRCHW